MEQLNLNLSDNVLASKVNSCLARLHISGQEAARLKSTFESEMEKGMASGLDDSSLQMENTYVPELMSGGEEGRFLALDLGGTNFRVILLEVAAGKIAREKVNYYSVKEATRLGPGSELFDFLASCIFDFVSKVGLTTKGRIPLGFTFSFPMTQSALNKGVLVNWTKSFNCPGVIGEDAVKLLNEALERKRPDDLKVEIEVVAILNDTTGTLVKGAYDDPETRIGLILGTGCNGAYLEKAERVTRWGGVKYDAREVIVDPGEAKLNLFLTQC